MPLLPLSPKKNCYSASLFDVVVVLLLQKVNVNNNIRNAYESVAA